jgi:hypothetical protein
MKTVEDYAMTPFTELEMNYLVNLPTPKIEQILGLQSGEYDWAKHYPDLMAKQRVLLAQALFRELHKLGWDVKVEKSYWLDGAAPAAPNLGG